MVSLRIGALKMERVQVKSEEFKEQKEYRHDRRTIEEKNVKWRVQESFIGPISQLSGRYLSTI